MLLFQKMEMFLIFMSITLFHFYLPCMYLYYFSYPFQELYEFYFVFACIWAFGSSLYHDGTIDHRAEFSKYFRSEFKNVTFPNNGNVFDFYVDNTVIDKQSMMPWVNRVPKFELDPDVPLQAVLYLFSFTLY